MQPERISDKLFTFAVLSTVFLGAFLLFSVQPMLAKFILPWFGGNQAVWIVCLLFFQTFLLLGYAYSFFVAKKFTPFWTVMLQMGLLALAAVFLPVIPDEAWKLADGFHPILKISGLLAATVGLPYLVLATTATLLQTWWDRLRRPRPYRLYAFSNFASLLGLLAFPFLFEVFLSSRQQAWLWSWGFGLYAASFIVAGILYLKLRPLDETASAAEKPTADRPGLGSILSWVGLSAAGSLLLLSLSNAITEEVAPVPFLWVLPFAVYLLTFIMVFHDLRWYRPKSDGVLFFLLLLCWAGLANSPFVSELALQILTYSLLLFTGCLVCHGEMARTKPHPSHLTHFYLAIALGGALGGVVVGVVAPLTFNNNWELPITLSLVSALAFSAIARESAKSHDAWADKVIGRLWWLFPLAVGVIFVSSSLQVRGWIYASRNFYGILKVAERDLGAEGALRVLYNRRINHGSQFLAAEKKTFPTTYYGPDSGAGLLFRSYPESQNLRIGAIGLGAGTITAYAQAGDYIRYYELNPEVEAVAKKYFTFLSDSPAEKDIVIGDARLSLQKEPPQNFDVLVVDAFSGDAIPAHLITREAMRVYLRHLNPGGAIAFHITNSHLDLRPVLATLMKAFGLSGVLIDSKTDAERGLHAASWIILSADESLLNREKLAKVKESGGWQSFATREWTDDYSNLFNILK